jgi:hypothetical protein
VGAHRQYNIHPARMSKILGIIAGQQQKTEETETKKKM